MRVTNCRLKTHLCKKSGDALHLAPYVNIIIVWSNIKLLCFMDIFELNLYEMLHRLLPATLRYFIKDYYHNQYIKKK